MKEEEANLPVSFQQTVKLIERYVIQEIKLETQKKQLYYHTVSHALAVKSRANLILNTIYSQLEPQPDFLAKPRIQGLIDIAALSHDMVQEFVDNNSPRKRPRGVSESASIVKLTHYIQNLNTRLKTANYAVSICISDRELAIIIEAIEATICHSGLFDYSLYQSDLYNKKDLSLVAKILALADLGTLGMNGIEAYIKEGILIFLEDNLDIAKFLMHPERNQLMPQNLESRILKVTCFMVNFAQERYERFDREIDSFDREVQNILKTQLFEKMTKKNIDNLITIIPHSHNNKLEELLEFINKWLK